MRQCLVPQPLIVEQLREFGIEISVGQVNRLLIEEKAAFATPQQEVLSAGLETAEYVHTDDTSARHQGRNGYCTVIGNDLFAYNSRSSSKSRENYLRLLRGQSEDYVLNEYARSYLTLAATAPEPPAPPPIFQSHCGSGGSRLAGISAALRLHLPSSSQTGHRGSLIGECDVLQGLSPDLIIRKCWSQTVCHSGSRTLLDSLFARHPSSAGKHCCAATGD